MLGSLLGRGDIAIRRSRKRSIEMVLSNLELRRRRPKHRCRLRCSRNSRRKVAGGDARLQLANPIPRGGKGHLGLALQTLLEAALVELPSIEGCKGRPQSTEHADHPVLPRHTFADKSQLHPPIYTPPLLAPPPP